MSKGIIRRDDHQKRDAAHEKRWLTVTPAPGCGTEGFTGQDSSREAIEPRPASKGDPPTRKRHGHRKTSLDGIAILLRYDAVGADTGAATSSRAHVGPREEAGADVGRA